MTDTSQAEPFPLWTPRELMGYVKISRGTISNWIERGDLTPLRLPGGQLRFTTPEVQRLMSEAGFEHEVRHPDDE